MFEAFHEPFTQIGVVFGWHIAVVLLPTAHNLHFSTDFSLPQIAHYSFVICSEWRQFAFAWKTLKLQVGANHTVGVNWLLIMQKNLADFPVQVFAKYICLAQIKPHLLQIKRSVTVLWQAQYSVDKYSKGGDSPWFHGRLSAPVPCPSCLLRKLALRATLWPYPTSAPPWKPHPRSRRTLYHLCFSGFQSLLLLPRHAVIQLWESFKITITCCWCVKKLFWCVMKLWNIFLEEHTKNYVWQTQKLSCLKVISF